MTYIPGPRGKDADWWDIIGGPTLSLVRHFLARDLSSSEVVYALSADAALRKCRCMRVLGNKKVGVERSRTKLMVNPNGYKARALGITEIQTRSDVFSLLRPAIVLATGCCRCSTPTRALRLCRDTTRYPPVIVSQPEEG